MFDSNVKKTGDLIQDKEACVCVYVSIPVLCQFHARDVMQPAKICIRRMEIYMQNPSDAD